jgi:glycosyltransferase involved in cell wall biosynthesis
LEEITAENIVPLIMSADKQNLLIVSELFPPDETSTAYIMGEVANKLAEKYNVTVICGPEVYDETKRVNTEVASKLRVSIKILRVSGVKENKASKISRVKKFLLISYKLYKVVKENIGNADKVFMVSNPFPLIVMMGHLRRKRPFELTMLVHDVFPESLYTEFKMPGLAYRISERMFNRAYASVDKMISLGRDMTEVMRGKTKPYNSRLLIEQIENWGDVENIVPMEHSSDNIVIEYAGNIGRAQGVSQFLRTVVQVNNPSVMFSIWGTGSESDSIRDYIEESKTELAELHGPYSRAQQVSVLNACDMALVTLVDGMYGLGVPSKTYNILCAGKPILFIGALNSEVALMIKENHIGFCFDSSDTEGLKRFLSGLNVGRKAEFYEMGKRARKLVEQRYSKAIILDKFLKVV